MQGKVFNFIPQQERAPFWAPSKVGSGLIAHMEQLVALLLGQLVRLAQLADPCFHMHRPLLLQGMKC